MFADPITITISGSGKVLARTSSNGTSSVYESADGNYKLSLSHQITKEKIRTLARLDSRAIVADPLTSVNDYETLTTFCVFERPTVGFTQANVEAQWAGFNTWFVLNATQVKLYGKES
jgi:hypothetical protein